MARRCGGYIRQSCLVCSGAKTSALLYEDHGNLFHTGVGLGAETQLKELGFVIHDNYKYQNYMGNGTRDLARINATMREHLDYAMGNKSEILVSQCRLIRTHRSAGHLLCCR